jgi:hypothetical protein
MIMKKRNLFSDTAALAARREPRLTHSEIKIYCAVDIREIHKEIDYLSQQFRELDIKIQEKNWAVDLE